MKPFFIGGFQRSGTTLLRLMFDNHPQIAIPLDTTDLWFRYHQELARYNGVASSNDLRAIVNDLLTEERIKLWGIPIEIDSIIELVDRPGFPGVIAAFYKHYARVKGKPCWGEKNPGSLRRMDLLNEWFPDGQFIHIIRDGRDSCLSHLEQEFGHDDVLLCASDWREELQWVRRMGRLVGAARYAEVRYEDLVRNPENELRRLCVFLEIPYDPLMLKYHERVSQSIPDSKLHIWPKIVKPPQADNVNLWKARMSRGLQICFEKRAGSMLNELGYEVTPGPWSGGYYQEIRSLALRAWRVVRGRLKIHRSLPSRKAPAGTGA